jgi:hypothetical protein
MIDFLYSLDYDDNRLDTEDQPPISGPHNLMPPVAMFKFQDIGSIPVASEAAITEQPTRLNPLALLVNAKIYIIADKYDIRALKEWAVAKYKEVLPGTWNSTSFIESASLVFENTPESDRMLREVIIRKASENAKALFDRGEFVALLQSHGDFATEVLRDVVLNRPGDVPEVEQEFEWGTFATTKKDKKKNRF